MKNITEENGEQTMLKVETWPIERLVPYCRNPRKNDEQVDRMVSAIKEFGFRIPVVAKSDGSVVDGHLRLKAAQKLGMTEVPVALADELTDAQVKAFRLLANKSANWAAWDDDLLKLELTELQDMEYDMEMTGFDLAELDSILEQDAEGTEGLTDDDEVPETPEEPITREGDIWILGKHRLMCGDSLSVTDMEKLCCGQLVDMWLTDPPYNVAYVGKTKDALTIQNDKMQDADFRQFLRDAYSVADITMKPGAVFYIWHADSEGYNFRGAAADVGWIVRQCSVWQKQSMVLGRQDYQWQHEPCLYGWKEGASHLWTSDRKQTTLLQFDRPSRNKEHPTMKPVALFEYLLKNNTKKDNIVLDSFGGSGTTLIAAEKNNRVARLMELDPHYCDVIIKRWQDFTGQQATLEADGKTFEEVQNARN